jgi:adenylyl-sulfate kinase
MPTSHPVLWFMGLSAAGKSTLSAALEESLQDLGWPVARLDADELRQGLNQGLGYTEADRLENIRRAAHVARLLSNHATVLAAFITPYAEMRQLVRTILPEAVLIYVKCPVEECVRRDPKGLYRRALSGAIQTFTGISDAFEEPEDADLVVDTSRLTVPEALDAVVRYCQAQNRMPEPLPSRLAWELPADVWSRLRALAKSEGHASVQDYLIDRADGLAHR